MIYLTKISHIIFGKQIRNFSVVQSHTTALIIKYPAAYGWVFIKENLRLYPLKNRR
jgi:hypothetical protein